MKKVLLTSTALVAFAGAAQAEVLITGNAEMGIYNSDGHANDNGGDTEFFQDVDVDFTLTGETDGGLAFGANVDLDEAGNLGDEDENQGVDVFISGSFGTLTLGDTDGALDWALTEVAFNSGSINDDETEHAGYNGNSGLDGTFDGQILRYDYSFGDFGVAVSAEIDDSDDNDSDPILGLGFKYQFDFGANTVGVGIGYQATDIDDSTPLGIDSGDWEAIGASINGGFGDFQAGLSFLTVDAPTDVNSYDHIGVGVGFSSGAISLSANYGEFDYDAGEDSDGYGLSAGYDLGGGAAIQLGYANGDERGTDEDSFSFGVSMSF
ncbi:porin [Jannaschia sp. S6380]|uniref:porin n=1 Tax=Jannaschia sp. S6380 TaxID=2926408 RepID=UPI001FF36941|nr:porin [Jannaschia sp. S6380]MCK0168742.1 porin [Jannaschia sp. S6380]